MKDLTWRPTKIYLTDKYLVNNFKFNTEECFKHKNFINNKICVKDCDEDQDEFDYYEDTQRDFRNKIFTLVSKKNYTDSMQVF